VVKGTCATCHNGTLATGKTTAHISTTASCDTCHKTTGWKTGNKLNGPQQRGERNLRTCHNGTLATGKTTAHIPPRLRATPATRQPAGTGIRNHSNATPGTCAGCHNGTSLRARATHISTTASCDTATENRLETADRHDNGSQQRGERNLHQLPQRHFRCGKTSMHTYTTASCDTCHKSTAWLPTTISTIDFPWKQCLPLWFQRHQLILQRLDTAEIVISFRPIVCRDRRKPTRSFIRRRLTLIRSKYTEKTVMLFSTDNSEIFYALAPFSVFGSLNNFVRCEQ